MEIRRLLFSWTGFFLFISSYVKMNSKVYLTRGFGQDNITEIAKQNNNYF